jgi:hypothetical protein
MDVAGVDNRISPMMPSCGLSSPSNSASMPLMPV